MKLQDAYFTEINEYGGWGKIGYTPAGTGSSTSYKATTFTYTGAREWDESTKTGKEDAWKAVNTETALNDCDKGKGEWTIKDETASTVTKYDASIKENGGNNNDCAILTPSFLKVVGK